MSEVPPSCDVAIVGGGLAGTAAALSLARLSPSRSVVLVDAGTRQHPAHAESLPADVRPLLEQLGCWDEFLAEGFEEARGTLAAWGDSDLVSRPYLFAPAGRGWQLERSALADLLARAARSRGVVIVDEARLAEIAGRTGEDRGWALEIERRGKAARLTARFVIDATGRQAHLARRLGARKVRFDRLVGAFVVFAGSRSSDAAAENPGPPEWDALMEAREEGFWYCAPRSKTDEIVVALSTDADLAREGGIGDDRVWHRLFRESALAARIDPEIHLPKGPPTIRAMDSHRLDHLTGPGWLAVGDAAATVDFLVGRGLYQALDMGIRAASAALDDLAGRRTGLHRYQRLAEERFEKLLETRRDVYAHDSRFRDKTFWLRRQDRVTLDHDQLVAFTESADRESRIDGLGMFLPNDQLRLLCSLCVAPRLVDAVLAAFREELTAPGSSPPSDRRLLLALQYLVEQGLVTAE